MEWFGNLDGSTLALAGVIVAYLLSNRQSKAEQIADNLRLERAERDNAVNAHRETLTRWDASITEREAALYEKVNGK